ncbi:MAG: SLOG family protein [Oscillospiraceae bacterium]
MGKISNYTERSDNMNKTTVCFTGHRPEKLPFKGGEELATTNVLKSVLYKAIYDSIEEGYSTFITGMARGIDVWAADMVIEFKLKNPKIRLVCVKPYATFGNERRGYEKWEFAHILEKADEVISLSDVYTKDCLRIRNQYMVDHSEKVIAVVANYVSGTGQTIRYAQKKGLEMRIIDLKKSPEIFYPE